MKQYPTKCNKIYRSTRLSTLEKKIGASGESHINAMQYLRNQMGQGWRSGESHAGPPPMWPGLKFPRRRHMWVEFVVGSLLREVFTGTLVFGPSPQKPTLPHSNSIWNARTRLDKFLKNVTPTYFVGKWITKLGKYNKGAREVRVHVGTCTLDKSLIDLLKYLKD